MATKIIKEIDIYSAKYHFNIGIFFCLFLILIFYFYQNINNNSDSIPFVATFNYVEGINNKSEVKLAGIKVGHIDKIRVSKDGIIINGYIERKFNVPEDSIMKIRSDGIFGRKALFIEPGFGEYLDKSKNQYIFKHTQDSYSVDMFLRYLNNLNE